MGKTIPKVNMNRSILSDKNSTALHSNAMSASSQPKPARQSNFELLRVIAMLMVTILHALGHGGVLEQYEFGSFGYIFWWFIETLSYVSVNLFILITGYFMVNSNFKISRIINLAVQVEFYSLICLMTAKFVLHEEINLEDIIRAIFPLTGGIYWFVSAYAVLIILSPFLNKFIHLIDKNTHLQVCLLLIGVFCVIPTFFFWGHDKLSNGSDFVWFIVLYFSAAYINLYNKDTPCLNYKRKRYFIIYVILCILCVLSRLLIGQACKIIFGRPNGAGLFYSYNSIIIFAASVSLFMFSKNFEIKNNLLSKSVISIGSVCFGAYLWSDNPFLRKPLWDFVSLPQMVKNVMGGVILIPIAVLIIFLIGCIIEWFRSVFLNVTGISKLMKKIDFKFENIICKVTLLYNDKENYSQK